MKHHCTIALNMKTSLFDYNYPNELVAQHPLADRNQSRMMVLDRAKKTITHSFVNCLAEYLSKEDVLVLNNTKVVPARLFGKRSKGEPIELLVVEPSPRSGVWRCLIKKAKNFKPHEQLFFGMQATGKALGRDGIYLLVEFKGRNLKLAMEHHGVPPLPPYINRDGFKAYSQDDRERYQTIFAKKAGSAAAPTAGLHLNESAFETFADKGIQIEEVTLHVGIDTFAPLRAEDTSEHKMHGERIEISETTAENINNAKQSGKRIIALGTTSVRVLESAASEDGFIKPGKWTTELFITPGYEFKIVDGLLTNFHQPKSTLIMMVSAFVGKDFLFECYQEAIKEKYRLFSYGDCMLIL